MRRRPPPHILGIPANALPIALLLLATLAGCQAPASSVGGETSGDAVASVQTVAVASDDAGDRLQVDGRDVFVVGVNWDYFPIGTTYDYRLWDQPDDFIEAALDREMTLLNQMGVNAIRQYEGVPPRWVAYIYANYGIYTILNHPLGRYGVTLDGAYVQNTDYADPRARALLVAEVEAMVTAFADTPGVLMWLLGNENNYGLVWSSAETEALPEGERDAARARHLYTLFGEAARAIKAIDTKRPVAMANGDLQYLDLIAETTTGLDIFGTNTYRGLSFGDLYQQVKTRLGLPVLLTEFGADAYDAKAQQEDQRTQARYLLHHWQEIYGHADGLGGVGNSIGGLTFQWSDGWWKHLQDRNLDVHDVFASWHNAGYTEDYVQGVNNMNEEWWGIVAKGPTDSLGFIPLHPRAAYYALVAAHRFDPYAPGQDEEALARHFKQIDLNAAVQQAQ